MKNLPDKIYLSFGEMSEDKFEKEDYKEFCEQHNNLVDFLKNKFWETDVEYTRTDAFIEKAVQYLKDHKEEVETEDNGIVGWISDCFIKDFVKYMKGG